MKARKALTIGAVGLSAWTFASLAFAQDADETAASDAAGQDEPAADEAAAGEAGTEGSSEAGDSAAEESTDEDPTGAAGKEANAEAVADAEAGNSPIELPGKSYQFVGLRYRGIIVPKFMMNLFGDGGETVYVNAFGPEFAIRKDGFEYNFSLWYADYGMDPTPFKAKDDPVEAWEIVESKIKVLYLTADFLWSNEFTPEFALNYGMGAGLGIVFGDLIREQAMPPPGGNAASDPYDWEPCPAKFAHPYCDDDNDHYNGYTEPSWASGGSKPIVFPWFAIQTGLRYKPHKNFVARLDVGFGTSGFFFGIGADYGL